jgi:tetratricopeptide (TPR) repeat protein
MNRVLLSKLINKATEMALANKWGENAFKINKMILEIDNNNSAACTRLAKYFKLHNNFSEARNMYSKALEINPNNQGARNNLIDLEKHENEQDFIDKLTTGKAANDAARVSAQKGKYELSIKCLLKAYNIEPLIKYAVTLAKIYNKIGKYDEVKKLYTQLLDTDHSPQNIDIINSEFKLLLQR